MSSRSSRSRDDDDILALDINDNNNNSASTAAQDADAADVHVPSKPTVAIRTLDDRSTYHGEINSAREPHGAGILDSCFGLKYTGGFVDGKKHGFGVQMYINGAMYAGAFADDQPSGYGVHTSPFAEKYIGAWREGARNGIGVCIQQDASLECGEFVDNELDPALGVSWLDVQESMQRALLAERRALQSQETARERQIQAALEAASAVGTCMWWMS